MQPPDPCRALPGEKRRILAEIPAAARRVVDVGCGEGDLSYCISVRLPGTRVVGIDGDRGYVEQARQRHRRENLEFRYGHLEDLTDEPYEVAVFCSVIEHLPNVGTNLAALNRLVAPGGCLLIDTDNAYSLKFLVANLYYSITKRRPSTYLWHQQDRHYWWNHHLYSWTLSSLTTLLALYGFELQDYWFTNHYRPRAYLDRVCDWATALVPGLRRHVVLKLTKVGEPTILERSPS